MIALIFDGKPKYAMGWLSCQRPETMIVKDLNMVLKPCLYSKNIRNASTEIKLTRMPIHDQKSNGFVMAKKFFPVGRGLSFRMWYSWAINGDEQSALM